MSPLALASTNASPWMAPLADVAWATLVGGGVGWLAGGGVDWIAAGCVRPGEAFPLPSGVTAGRDMGVGCAVAVGGGVGDDVGGACVGVAVEAGLAWVGATVADGLACTLGVGVDAGAANEAVG